MRQWAALKEDRVIHGFDATVDFVESLPEKLSMAATNNEYVPPWYDSEVEFVDITDEEPRPVIGWYRENNTWIDGNPRLSTDLYIIPANSSTGATVTFSQKGLNAPSMVVFDINGVEVSESLSSNGVATCEVVSSNPGDIIVVSTHGLSVTITVED